MNITEYSVSVPHTAQVHVFDLNDQIDASAIVNAVYDFRTKYPYSNTSNVVGWHTDYFAHKFTPDFDQLISAVEQCVFTAINDSDFDVSVVQCWAAIYNKGDGAKRHKHSDTLYSAVYYAQAEPNASPLKFDNGLTIISETGMLVCFPGWLHHEVPAMRFNSDRVAIAFNLNCTLKRFEDRR
jgi:hypothetical protein